MAGNKNIFRPPLKRFTCLLRQDMTPGRFLELAAAQNPGFARQQFHLWHTSRLASGDSILVFRVEPGLARFIERKRGKIFCGAGQVNFKSRVGPSGPPAVAGTSEPPAVARLSGPPAAVGPSRHSLRWLDLRYPLQRDQ